MGEIAVDEERLAGVDEAREVRALKLIDLTFFALAGLSLIVMPVLARQAQHRRSAAKPHAHRGGEDCC